VPLPPETRSLLNFVNAGHWGSQSDEQIAEHITRIRDRVFKIDPWPCLTRFAFLAPRIRKGLTNGIYEEVLAPFRTADREDGAASLFLDFATGLGQEARAVVEDGVPASSVVGADLLPEFIQAGLELFGDGTPEGDLKTRPGLPTSEITWVQCDIFKEADVATLRSIPQARGADGFHVIFVGSFLHCFNLERQRHAVQVLASLLSNAPGSCIVGRHTAIGAGVEPGETQAPPGLKRAEFQNSYRHDETSFTRDLWDWE
ncbi:hypothetical protein V8E36_006906, partial [Tilletia maclaganii]